jgi:hypothetical protein
MAAGRMRPKTVPLSGDSLMSGCVYPFFTLLYARSEHPPVRTGISGQP